MKLICPDCGKQYESGKFCLECGAKLQEVAPELVCPSCGFKTKTGKFCPECGTKLTENSAIPLGEVNNVPEERKFNDKDDRFAKYYDKKGFPRNLPQEELAIAIEELTSFAEQGIAEAKMLLGNILFDTDMEKGLLLIKEAEQSGDKLAYYLMAIGYMGGLNNIVNQDHNEAEKRMLECYQEFEDEETAGALAQLYTFSDEKCDYLKALEYAKIAAENDNEDGYSVLGALYLNGWGVEKNVELALENYKMAAAFGDINAMNQIGFIFMGSDDYDANPEQTFFWCNEAAKKGSDIGMNNLAYCYQHGIGVNQDEEIAAEWYKKAAELGYVNAMYKLGVYYQNIIINSDKAKMWYQKAAELGHAEAMNCLGVIYSEEEGNYNEAVKYFEKAVELELPMAYRNLALCYRDGNGVKQDLRKAEELFTKASELGVEDAGEIKEDMVTSQEDGQIDMANALLEQGKDNEATAIYIRLAENGNARAQLNLGRCLLYGRGMKQNLKEGLEWLEKSANQKNAYACINLAEVYLGYEYKGKSFPANSAKAAEYIALAKEYGADSNEVKVVEELAIPSVKFHECKVITDIKKGNDLGFELCLKMIANGMVGKKLNMSLYCVWTHDNEEAMKELSMPGTPNKLRECCKYAEIVDCPYPSTTWESCRIFISYKSVLSWQDEYNGALVLIAWDHNAKKPKPLAAEEFPFHISCKSHTFRPDEWKFQLLSQTSHKKLVKVPEKLEETDSSKSLKESKVVEKLPMNVIIKAANANYPKPSLKNLAIATLKIAEVIQEKIPNADVSYMAHPSVFDRNIHPDALPIHFLFKKNGVPKVAVVAVTSNGYNTPLVLETKMSCERNGIEYVRVYADGTYSDWMQKGCDPKTIEFCKKWLVDKINNAL